jgi:uncharacterized SAM-binding protein YcdF (DUF218 family)
VAVFYWLSKTLDLCLSPLFWSLVLSLTAARTLQRGRPRAALRLGGFAFVLLYLPSIPLIAHPLTRYVEEFDGPSVRRGVVYDGVVVLGGNNPSRVLTAFELLHSGAARRALIVAGGPHGRVEADEWSERLRRWGIAEDRLLLGRNSLNTRQNATEARMLVDHGKGKLKRLVLVTSAFHMQRALECFRAVGLSPDAAVSDRAKLPIPRWFDYLAPRVSNLSLSELALRELAGRWVYRWTGYATS